MCSQVLSEHAQYNEKADVYSFGVMIWYVSQHLYLGRNTQLFRTATEHRSLMTPYRFGGCKRASCRFSGCRTHAVWGGPWLTEQLGC
jgi:hypothetical protein